MPLTGRKRAFADAVLAGLSNKDAAIAAKYSPATASAAGSRLVKDAEVAKYLAQRRVEPAKPAVVEPERAAFDLNALVMHSDPKTFLLAAMNDAELDLKIRVDAAKALMPFVHQKLGEGGKKEQQKDAANKVASRFAPAPPPKLVAAGGKKV